MKKIVSESLEIISRLKTICCPSNLVAAVKRSRDQMRERKWSLPLEERLSELKRAVSPFEAFKMEYRADERKHGAASQIQESHSPFRKKSESCHPIRRLISNEHLSAVGRSRQRTGNCDSSQPRADL